MAWFFASPHGLAKNVLILAISVPKTELGDIEGQYFGLTLWKVPTTPRFIRDQKP
jgi:hypothetical protein